MAGGSKKAVYSAIIANSVVTVAKLVAFFITGSGAMLSEAIHSAADVANQSLLALGIKRSQKEPDEEHPYGYTRAQFTWALISAVGIFFLGCGVTLVHGIHSVQDPHLTEKPLAAYIVLGIAFVVEGWSLLVAFKAVKQTAADAEMTLRQYIVGGPDPMGVAVLVEDAAAVFGVCLAAIGLALGQITQNGVWDGVASIAIAILLGLLAIFLIQKNRVYLLSKAVDSNTRDKVEQVLNDDDAVEKIEELKAVVTGAGSAELRAKIDFDGRVVARHALAEVDLDALHAELKTPDALRTYLEQFGETMATQMAKEIDRLEDQISEAVPSMTDIDLEAE